jgi:hypothetical protein
LPELNWIVAPVPKYFTVTTSYEYQVQENPRNYDDLGKYAFVTPFNYRFGDFRWFITYSDVRLNIETNQFDFSNVTAHCLNYPERTAPLEYSISAEDDKDIVEMNMSKFDTFNPYFVVVCFDVPQEIFPTTPQETFPTVLTAVSVISAIAIATGTLIYFKKRKDGKKVKI